MSITSLSKFSVPVSGEQTNASLLMPKLKYRFRVVMTGFGGAAGSTDLTKQVMNVTRPGISFENVELNVYNSKINYAGRYTWADVSLVLRDDASGKVSQLVGDQIQRQFDFMEQSSAASAGDYKFTTAIEILDGSNGQNTQVLESFELYGCYIQNSVYSNTDYSSSDPVDITLTLKYDNAIQYKGSGSTGGASGIGRALGNIVRGQLATG